MFQDVDEIEEVRDVDGELFRKVVLSEHVIYNPVTDNTTGDSGYIIYFHMYSGPR